jgi:hypothetical protein
VITGGFKVVNGLEKMDGLATNFFNITLQYVIRLLSVRVKSTIFYIILHLIQDVQLKSGPYFNMSNLITKIYNMLYYTTDLYLQ